MKKLRHYGYVAMTEKGPVMGVTGIARILLTKGRAMRITSSRIKKFNNVKKVSHLVIVEIDDPR